LTSESSGTNARDAHFPDFQVGSFALLSTEQMRVHEEKITIRFADADPAGVVFYPRAIALAHSVVEDLIRHSPLGWEAWFASPTHAAPLRHAEADFLRPMKPGENFTARAAVEATGTTSVTFLVEFLDLAGRTAARVRTVHVLIDKKSGAPVPLTGEILSAFA
jgi:acyl-CoA thioesterase FadM